MKTNRQAYSLIELLVSCAVFLILIGVTLQIFKTVSHISDASQRRMETMKQAMSALERVSYDLHEAVHSGSANLLVIKNADPCGNDALVFVATVASSSTPESPRLLSVVKYSIAEKTSGTPDFGGWPTIPAFSRTVRPLSWSDDLGAILPLSETTSATAVASGSTQQVSPGVIRYGICFQRWDGSIVANPPSDPAQVRALICGIVAIDKIAATRLSAAQRTTLASQFATLKDGERPFSVWKNSLNTLPQATRETVRIYEQVISI
ncbi:MAG: type II secretion system protein J [Chthoniobacteraceae bacterium]